MMSNESRFCQSYCEKLVREQAIRLTGLLILVALVSGCVNTGKVPVRDVGRYETGEFHRVQRGDTLYSIAWRYNLDYKTLATVNNIKAPYTIYVDQKIMLRGQTQEENLKSEKKEVVKKSPRVVPKKKKVTNQGELVWRWPIRGEVIKPFSLKKNINKGIDIKGKAGQRVSAAADGMVVYAGGNLRGYGKLVIIKHNESFLSAYGNNQEILVREGEQVKGGQMVAKVGTTAGKVEMLHFEVRLNGRPEDPLKYLP